MKTAIIVSIFLAAVLILWRLNLTRAAPIEVKDSKLIISGKGCTIELPISESNEESIDALDISRYTIKLPNGGYIIYETVDLPLRYNFSLPDDALAAKLFDLQKYTTSTLNKSIVVVKGRDSKGRTFSVLTTSGGNHTFELIYPLDEKISKVLTSCIREGKREEIPNTSVIYEEIKPNWSEKSIIIENLIEKDM